MTILINVSCLCFQCLRSVPSIQRKLLYIVFATALISLVYLLTTTSEDTNRDTKNVHKFHQQQETSSKVEERKDADKDKGAVGSVITGAIKPNQPGDVKVRYTLCLSHIWVILPLI